MASKALDQHLNLKDPVSRQTKGEKNKNKKIVTCVINEKSANSFFPDPHHMERVADGRQCVTWCVHHLLSQMFLVL